MVSALLSHPAALKPYVVFMPKVCLTQGLEKRLHICLFLLVPCGPDDEDGWVISVHNVAPLMLAQLVNEAKLKYMYLVANLTGHSRSHTEHSSPFCQAQKGQRKMKSSFSIPSCHLRQP